MKKSLFSLLILFPCSIYSQSDFDRDGIDDSVDNCPYLFNPDQEDLNQDGIGDICTWSDILIDHSVSLMEDSPIGFEINLNDIFHNPQIDRYTFDVSSLSETFEVVENNSIRLKVPFNSIEERILYIPITLKSEDENSSKIDSLEIRKISKVSWERYIDEPQNGYETYYYYSVYSGSINNENEFIGPEQFAPMGNQKNFHFEDLDSNGMVDIIGEYHQIWSDRVNGRFYFGRNGIPTYVTLQKDWSINTYQEDSEKPDDIFHNADLFISEDFDGDGIKELVVIGEHYHSAFIDERDIDKKQLAVNVFKDLGFLENKDYDISGKKLVRIYELEDGRYKDSTVKRINNSDFDGNPFVSIFGHAVGDIDNDGDLDIVLTVRRLASDSCTNGSLNILINDGLGNFTGSFYCEDDYNVHSRSEGPNLLVDINGDGVKDYLFSGANSDGFRNQIGYYLNNGDGSFNISEYVFIESLFSQNNLAFKDIYLFDVDGDSKSKEIFADLTI
jgi:hypothetical protein